MSDRNDDNRGRPDPWEPQRSEPEIIPPDRSGRPRRVWVSMGEGGTRRIYVARPGPFAVIVALAVLALIAAVMLIVLLSVAVIWIPVVIVLIAAFVLSVTLRRYWWRLRNWLAPR